MPVNYNFAFKNSKLKRWERPAPKNLLVSEASIKKKAIYLYQVFKGNPSLFLPPSFILIATIATQLITIYPSNIIKRLESKHIEYTQVTQKISTLKSRFSSMKKHLNNIKGFYSEATPVYLFTFYLQNSVPQGVQLYDYSINDSGFELLAGAYGIEPLNELITLLLESPIIRKESITIKRISRAKGSEDSIVEVEINGAIQKLSLDKRKDLYEESSANGLLEKLLRFNSLNQLLRS